MTTTANKRFYRDFIAAEDSFRLTVSAEIGDRHAQAAMWTSNDYRTDVYAVRLSTGAEFHGPNWSVVIAKAREFWLAHQRLIGEHSEDRTMGAAR